MTNTRTPIASVLPRVALYARVSSRGQADSDTISSQIAIVEERIAKDGLIVDSELRFIDDGFTGTTLARPALDRLRDAVAAGLIGHLYVSCPDRLARAYAYQVLLIDELRRCGVKVVFLNRGLSDNPEDSLLLQVQGMVAEYERAKILERCRRGKLHAAGRGSVNVLSKAPYGYRYVRASDAAGQAQFNVNLEEAQVVQKIFEWVGVDGLSINQVARRLTTQGIPSPTGMRFWGRSTVSDLLRNPAFKGQAAFGRTRPGPAIPRLRAPRGGHAAPRTGQSIYATPSEQWTYVPVPAIIDSALFELVDKQLAENRRRSRLGLRDAGHLLQGLIVCQQCGYGYYGSISKQHRYYYCGGTMGYRMAGGRACWSKSIRQEALDGLVWNDVRELLADPRRIEEELHRRMEPPDPDADQQARAKIEAQIGHARRGLSRLLDSYQEGLINKPVFEPRARAINQKIERLQENLKCQIEQEAQAKTLRLIVDNLKEFAKKVVQGLDQADRQAQRSLIRTLVKRIEIHQDQVRIVYRVTVDPFDGGRHRRELQHCPLSHGSVAP